jgi:hypothetical protein
VNDSGTARRSGGTAVANVLVNDRFAAALATVSKVQLSQLTSSDAGISLDTATGAVTVAAETPVGTFTLTYRICEIATPSNCDDATVTVSVLPYAVAAVADFAKGSSKVANTVLGSVLTNDRLGGAPATTGNVSIAFRSISPANNRIRLDTSDGSVDVLGKTT